MEVPKEALCPASTICDFRTVRDDARALVEICSRCHRKEVFLKADGDIDRNLYAKVHFRAFMQPFGTNRQLFLKEYGQAALDRMDKERATALGKKDRHTLVDEYRAEARDTYKTASRLESKGKL